MDIVQKLLEHGAFVNAVDDCNETPLFYALRSGHRRVLSHLLRSGSNTNHCDLDDETPLHFASSLNLIDEIDLLLEVSLGVGCLLILS